VIAEAKLRRASRRSARARDAWSGTLVHALVEDAARELQEEVDLLDD